MAVELADCVREILCGLSQPVISALNGAIQALLLPIDAQILFVQSQLLMLDVVTLPISIAAEAIGGLLEQIRAAADILPLNLAVACIDLGSLNLNISAQIDRLTADLAEYEQKLTRMLSFKEELAAVIEALNQIKDQYLAVQLVLQTCGA